MIPGKLQVKLIFQYYSMALNTLDTLPSAPQGYIRQLGNQTVPQTLGVTIILQVTSNKYFLILWQRMRGYRTLHPIHSFAIVWSESNYITSEMWPHIFPVFQQQIMRTENEWRRKSSFKNMYKLLSTWIAN